MDTFENHRRLLFSIAYRMVGSASEAEDIVQDAYLRYRNVPPDSVRSEKALLTTIVTRLSLNHLQSARARRETYPGPWLPEPIHTEDAALPSPADQAAAKDSLSLAFLVLLESLTPLERAVFLLREVFDYDYAEIADMLGKNEDSCRQLLSRAKKHVVENRPRFKASPEQHRSLLERFMQASAAGEVDGLVSLLAEDVTLWSDGGGKARGAAMRPLHGRSTVARFVAGSIHLSEIPFTGEIADINGEPAVLVRVEGKLAAVITIDVEGDRISAVRVIGNPDKLRHLA